MSTANAQGADKPSFQTEAERLEAVRVLISQEKSPRLFKYGQSKRKTATCEAMLSDLLSRKRFKAIEPLAVLNFDYPEWAFDLPESETKRNEEIAEGELGPVLSEGVKRCSKEEANGDVRRARVLFDGFGPLFGAPPFRVYALEKRENPFKEAKLIYWSEFIEELGRGRAGYSWVNLDTCEHVNGLSANTDSARLKNDPDGEMAALTSYRDKIVVWSVSRNLLFTVDSFESNYKTPAKSRISCNWATFSESPARK